MSDKNGGINLWLDDLRDPNRHGHIGWTWAKTADEAIALLRAGSVRRASLDHDLTVAQTLGQDDGEPTGLTVVTWIAKNDAWPEGGVSVHSQNPQGRAKMEAAIPYAHRR